MDIPNQYMNNNFNFMNNLPLLNENFNYFPQNI